MTDDQARSAEIAEEIGKRILAKEAAPTANPTTPGQAVVLVKVADAHTRLEPMATGVVDHVDGAGTVHIRWDPDGHVLGLIPGADEWRELHPRWQATPLVEVKFCPHCKRIKPVEEFALRNRGKTKRQSWCRDCINGTKKEAPRG